MAVKGITANSGAPTPETNQAIITKLLNKGYRPDFHTIAASILGDLPIPLLSSLVANYESVDLREDIQDHQHIQENTNPTALHLAIGSRRLETVKLLLQHNADVNTFYALSCSPLVYSKSDYFVDSDAIRTPLQAAIDTDAQGTQTHEMVQILIDAGADINAPGYHEMGATASQLAAMKGNINLLRRLVDLGADINARRADIWGRTCLEGAAEHGRLDTVQYLLNSGVKTEGVGNVQYVRAIKFAVDCGHMAVANIIRRHREWRDLDETLFCDPDLVGTDEYTDEYTAFLHPLEIPLEERRRLRRVYRKSYPYSDPEIVDSSGEDSDEDSGTESESEYESEYEDDSTQDCERPPTGDDSEVPNETHTLLNRPTNPSAPILPGASLPFRNQSSLVNPKEEQSVLQESDFNTLFRTDQHLNEQMMDIDFEPQGDELMSEVGNGTLMPLHHSFVETKSVDFHEEIDLDGFL